MPTTWGLLDLQLLAAECTLQSQVRASVHETHRARSVDHRARSVGHRSRSVGHGVRSVGHRTRSVDHRVRFVAENSSHACNSVQFNYAPP